MRTSTPIIACTLALSVLPSIATAQDKPLKEAVLGTWVVTAVTDVYEDGKRSDPWGPGVNGRFIFGADGSFTQIIIGEAKGDMKGPDPRRPDALTVVLMGRFTVDEASKTVTTKIERAANSMRNNSELTLAVSIAGDTLKSVGSPRKDQHGTFSPHQEMKRFK